MNAENELYPLLFTPIYKEKVWGGRSLEQLGRTLPGKPATRIGESWELADLSTTSVSGGGGSAEHSVVANGVLAGKTIRELMQTYGQSLLGQGVKPAADGGFPLLIKFLDASENLSVQVHPSPEYAAAHPGAHLKSEAWYVVDAKAGAVIYKGLKPGVTPEQLRAALKVNTDDAVLPLLHAVPVKKGDCHYLPSGTLHALGAGVLVAEVQTPSDTTFRVYDWGRTERELHIEQAMACIDFHTRPGASSFESRTFMSLTTVTKACGEYFRIDEMQSSSSLQIPCSQNGMEIIIVLEGQTSVIWPERDDIEIQQGQTVLLPHALVATHYMFWGKSGSRWLRVTLPDFAR